MRLYASQNFDFFESRSTEFPFETHRENLDNVLRIHPRVAVPSSAGFRFCEPHEWLNVFLFPISRERFVADLEQLEPGIHTCLLNPGDIVEVSNGKAKVHSGASEAARTIEQDPPRIDFDPTAAVPELVDPNPEGYTDEHLSRVVSRLIRQDMASYCQGGDDRALSLYRQHHARYAVAVVFPNGRVNRRGGRVSEWAVTGTFDADDNAPGASRPVAQRPRIGMFPLSSRAETLPRGYK